MLSQTRVIGTCHRRISCTCIQCCHKPILNNHATRIPHTHIICIYPTQHTSPSNYHPLPLPSLPPLLLSPPLSPSLPPPFPPPAPLPHPLPPSPLPLLPLSLHPYPPSPPLSLTPPSLPPLSLTPPLPHPSPSPLPLSPPLPLSLSPSPTPPSFPPPLSLSSEHEQPRHSLLVPRHRSRGPRLALSPLCQDDHDVASIHEWVVACHSCRGMIITTTTTTIPTSSPSSSSSSSSRSSQHTSILLRHLC